MHPHQTNKKVILFTIFGIGFSLFFPIFFMCVCECAQLVDVRLLSALILHSYYEINEKEINEKEATNTRHIEY